MIIYGLIYESFKAITMPSSNYRLTAYLAISLKILVKVNSY